MKKMTSTLLISSALVIAATTSSVSAGTLDTVKAKGMSNVALVPVLLDFQMQMKLVTGRDLTLTYVGLLPLLF